MGTIIKQSNIDRDGIHIGIPRTGTTSLTFCLELNRWHKKHMPKARWLEHITEEQWAGAFKYSMVRNPYSRAVSLWGITDYHRHGWGFDEFVRRRIRDGEGEDYGDQTTGGWIFWTQDEWLPGDMDYIGRFEQYRESVAEICRRLGQTRKVDKLAHENHGRYDGHWRDHYTPELARMVRAGWACDFERFGYEE
jgi:hypothetical protein